MSGTWVFPRDHGICEHLRGARLDHAQWDAQQGTVSRPDYWYYYAILSRAVIWYRRTSPVGMDPEFDDEVSRVNGLLRGEDGNLDPARLNRLSVDCMYCTVPHGFNISAQPGFMIHERCVRLQMTPTAGKLSGIIVRYLERDNIGELWD